MYQNGGVAGGALATTGAAAAMQWAWVGVALLTIGFALIALTKLRPKHER